MKNVRADSTLTVARASTPWLSVSLEGFGRRSLVPADGLLTIGSYFKNRNYKTRYMGKFHLTRDLDPAEVLKFKPTIATQDYLQDYDFDIYDKEGDAGYNNTGGFFYRC